MYHLPSIILYNTDSDDKLLVHNKCEYEKRLE